MPPANAISSLDELRRRLLQLPRPDAEAAAAARARQQQLTKPPGSLGRLEELALWLAAWQGRHPPGLERVAALVFAGNHGVAARGVSAYPSTVTAQMVANFEAGGAAINQLCRLAGADLSVVALDLERPTADFCEAPAMSEAECLDAVNRGMAAVTAGLDLLALGEMGIANTTSAAAICAALFGGPAAGWTGPGTGLDRQGVTHKVAVVGRALACHAEGLGDPLEVLRRLGGREIAAMAGALVAAREIRIPVLLDGFVAGAAAAIAPGPRAIGTRSRPGGALLGRTRSPPPARAPSAAAAAAARHAPRRGLRRRARDSALPRRACLPHRHGHFRERRRQRTGMSRRDITSLAVVYTWRGGRRRIISARRASRRERDAYRRTIT